MIARSFDRGEQRSLAEQSAKGCRVGSSVWWRGICLVCLLRTGKPDRRGSFSFHHVLGWYRCFKCGVVGRLRGYDDVDFSEDSAEQDCASMPPPEGYAELTRGEGKSALCLDPAREYLRQRGLVDEAVWSAAHLGACVEGHFRDRVIAPVFSVDGAWLGYVGRTWKRDVQIPYLYPRGMRRRDILYQHKALLEKTDCPVIVVEGVMDALALWPDAVALLGKPSDAQVFALADSVRPIAVCLDGDAWIEGQSLAMRLTLEGQRAGNIRLPPKTDPDEVSRSWIFDEARKVIT